MAAPWAAPFGPGDVQGYTQFLADAMGVPVTDLTGTEHSRSLKRQYFKPDGSYRCPEMAQASGPLAHGSCRSPPEMAPASGVRISPGIPEPDFYEAAPGETSTPSSPTGSSAGSSEHTYDHKAQAAAETMGVPPRHEEQAREGHTDHSQPGIVYQKSRTAGQQ